MFKLLILAIAAGAISATTDADWTVFKATHGKMYDGEVDTIRRFIWEENLKKIESHNALYAKGMTSYWLGENEYADMTTAEFVKTMNGYKGQSVASQTLSQGKSLRNLLLPSEVNWVKKGYVTAVKNQGQCGSCWAFSTTGSLEGAHFKKTGKLVSLSEKNLMDCSDPWGNMGCDGGLMIDAFMYVIANKGIDTEKSYPYVPKDGNCKFRRANVGSTEISYTRIKRFSEEALTQASATVGPISVAIDASHASFQLYKGGVGPISVAIDASHKSFQLYKGGVYDEPNCSPTQLDHGVLVVGYGTLKGTDYYLVKNSWGTTWGLEGYIMMSRNKNNQCGIATSASYPTV